MEEATAEFLCKASKLVPSSILQCHYLSKCRLMEESKAVTLPFKLFRTTATCRFCNNVFASGMFNLQVIPKKKPGKKMKKIIRKNEQSSASLTSFEKKLLEKCKKDKDNKLVLKCLMCKKITPFPLSKPVKVTSETEKLDEVRIPETNKKKKKRKKKDIYAGLNSSVVSTYTPTRTPVSSSKIQKIKDFSIVIPHRTSKQSSIKSTDNLTSAIKSPLLHSMSLNESDNSPLSIKSKQKRKFDLTTPVPTVREQIKKARQEIAAAEKKEKQRKKMAPNNSAKKAKKCNALKNILGNATSTPSPKPSLKDFFASLR